MAESGEAAGATPEAEGATPSQPGGNGAMPDEQLGQGGMAALARERELREAAEKQSRDLTKRLKAFEDRDKTESERQAEVVANLTRENEELKAARRSDNLRLAAAAEARKLGFRNPDIAYRLLSDVEYDEAGSPKGLAKQLDEVLKSDPYLAADRPDLGQGPRNTPPGGLDMDSLIRKAAGR